MEHRGKFILPDNHPDNFGEVVKFVHVKYPEWRLVLEPQIPFRDNVGNARGTQNAETALTVVFDRRSFVTNSRRIIEGIRSIREYRGTRTPNWINSVIDDGKTTGCVEVDRVAEAMTKKRAEIERRLRAELEAEMELAKAVPKVQKDPTAIEVETPAPVVVPEIVIPQEDQKVCTNCGTVGTGNFCAECGTPISGRLIDMPEKPKRTWACPYCGEEFASGFEVGEHKKVCQYRKQFEVDLPQGQQMIKGAGAGNIGPGRNPSGSPDMGGLL